MKQPRLGLVAASLGAVLSACSVPLDTTEAAAAVEKFHAQLDAGQSTAIYAATGEEFKKVSPQQEFVPLLDAVHRKLGHSGISVQNGWKVNYGTAGRFITMNYRTTYAEGEASEEFVFRLLPSGPLLVGYHVNSNALILK
jgi:hypothetical protein